MLLYDKRDNRLEPTAGYYASMGNDFAGVGFGVQYIRNKVNVGYYYSFAPEWVLSFTGEAGDIFGWGGHHVLLQDRFFVGGDNLRGFAAGRHRPARQRDQRRPWRATSTGSARCSSACRLGLPKEFGISGRVFTDFGTLWANDQKNIALYPSPDRLDRWDCQPQILDTAAIRAERRFRCLLEIAGRPDPA